jgi:hypothetical protein
VQLNETDCTIVLDFLRHSGPQKASAIVERFPAAKRPFVTRGLVWLAKMEAVRIIPPHS